MGISNIMKQQILHYTDILKKLKPDFVVHGDDWKEGVQKSTRDIIIKTLNDRGGFLIDVLKLINLLLIL